MSRKLLNYFMRIMGTDFKIKLNGQEYNVNGHLEAQDSKMHTGFQCVKKSL
jgi:hypothetical protein